MTLVHLRVALRRCALIAELAVGADPDTRPDLALCADRLTAQRSRAVLARSFRRCLDEARRPSLLRPPVVLVHRASVLDAEPALQSLIARLLDGRPVRAQGVAIAERIITDGDSPLYNNPGPDALRRLVLTALVAMETVSTSGHDFDLAA